VRCVDIAQPDVMWVGGLTELIRIGALAAAYGIPVVPHGSGAYSDHYVNNQPHTPRPDTQPSTRPSIAGRWPVQRNHGSLSPGRLSEVLTTLARHAAISFAGI
jgi:hypothetical protein